MPENDQSQTGGGIGFGPPVLKTEESLEWFLNWKTVAGVDYSLVYELAKEQRAELTDAWNRVERKVEIMFGLSVAFSGWLAVNNDELRIPSLVVSLAVVCGLAAAVVCGVAWWRSQKPMSANIKAVVDLTENNYDVKARIAGHTYTMSEQFREILTWKARHIKKAAWILAFGVAIASFGAIALREPPAQTNPQSSHS